MPGTEVAPRGTGTLAPFPGLPQRKRESEALAARWLRAARRNKAVTVPLAVPPVTWTAAEIMHAWGMGRDDLIAGAVLTVCVGFFAPHKWDRTPERWYAFLSAASLWVWTWAAAVLGPAYGTPGEVLAALLVVLSTAWGIPWYRHYRVRGRKDREKFLADCRRFWDGHHGFGAPGSNVTDAAEKPAQTWLRIQLIGGSQSLRSLADSAHLIESAARVGRGMVRVEEVEGDASQADVYIKRANPLRDVVEWDPSLAPRSVHETALQGKSETGEWRRVPQAVSSFVLGATRTGKSNDLLLHVLQLAACPDARTTVIDLKRRSVHALLPCEAVDYVITTVAEARAYLAMIEAEIAARSAEAYDGEEQLRATAGTPAAVTFCDEVNPLASAASGDAACARSLGIIASQGAGLAAYLRIYTQYGALHESVRSEQVRMNLDLRVCYRVKDPDHGSFAIKNYARYDASKLDEQGTHLLQVGRDTYAEHIRAPFISHDLFRAAVPEALSRRGPRRRWKLWCGAAPSAVPGLTWQEWWDQRWLRLDPRFRAISPQYAAAVEEFGEPAEAQAPGGAPARTAAAPLPRRDEDGGSLAAEIAAATSGPDAAPTASAAAKTAGTTAQRRQAFCDALAAAPGGISRKGLVDASGMSPAWVSDTLSRLAGRGAVTRQDNGIWAPVPGHSVHAELGAVRDGDASLLRLVHSAS